MVGDEVDGVVVVLRSHRQCRLRLRRQLTLSEKNALAERTSTGGREQQRRCSTAGRTRAARATTTAAWVAEAAPAASAFNNCREKRGAVGGNESDGDDDSGGEGLGDRHGGVGTRAGGLGAALGGCWAAKAASGLRKRRSTTNPVFGVRLFRPRTLSSPKKGEFRSEPPPRFAGWP